MRHESSGWSERWESAYDAAVPAGRERIRARSGVALMFHSVLDGRLAVRPGTIERILANDPAVLADVLARWGTVPDEIATPGDLVLGFAASFRDGRALQRMIRSERVFRWTLDRLGYDELALGGTSANMAIAVSALGVPRVLVYANPLTRPLAEAFPPDPAIETIGPDGATGSPRDVAKGDEVFAIHWILEYQAGDVLAIGPHQLVAPRANRFIPSWNPANNQLRLSAGFTRAFPAIAREFSHLLVSGFHILSDRYPDGTTAKDCILPVAEFLTGLRDRAPDLRVHCELASIAGKIVRAGVRKHILPRMDSLGLNETELATWLADLGRTDLAAALDAREAEPEASVGAALAGVHALAEATGIPRIHLHHLGYYLVLADPEVAGSPESIRQGLLTGACAAAIRAQTGRPPRWEELAPLSGITLRDESRRAMAAIAAFADDGADVPLTGIGRYHGRTIVMVPTRIVERPVRTVGLGDTISSASWLAER